MFRRLYRKIYLTIIAALVLTVLVAGMAWRIGAGGKPPGERAIEMIGILAVNPLPPAGAGRPEQQRAVERLSAKLGTAIALHSPDRRLIAAAGETLPSPPEGRRHRDGGWHYGHGGPALSLRLPDRRWLTVRPPRNGFRPGLGLILMLAAVAATIGLCAYPVVRGLTRRLEKLQSAVETLGLGHLATRVEVEGKDEVARLAESFNRSAGRIEELIAANRMLLANASHELRTPLTRIRLGLERVRAEAPAAHVEVIEADIGELDALIDELLLASRLDTNETLDVRETVDLLGLVAEECARYENCTLEGAPVQVAGDPALLRRLVRNLLDNAEKHGQPPLIVRIAEAGGEAILEVADHGAGIPPPDRDRVFDPFFRAPGARRQRGAGLGLALVRQIARRHGGRAEVAEDAYPPSTMRVVLPVA